MSDDINEMRKHARGEGEIDPEYAEQQAAAPEPQRRYVTEPVMDVKPNARTLINMRRDGQIIE